MITLKILFSGHYFLSEFEVMAHKYATFGIPIDDNISPICDLETDSEAISRTTIEKLMKLPPYSQLGGKLLNAESFSTSTRPVSEAITRNEGTMESRIHSTAFGQRRDHCIGEPRSTQPFAASSNNAEVKISVNDVRESLRNSKADGDLYRSMGGVRPVSYTHLTLPTKRIV